MDLFKIGYAGDLSDYNINPSQCTPSGDGSQIRILANRNDDGKKGALRKAIDAEYDDMKYGFAFGDTETETAVHQIEDSWQIERPHPASVVRFHTQFFTAAFSAHVVSDAQAGNQEPASAQIAEPADNARRDPWRWIRHFDVGHRRGFQARSAGTDKTPGCIQRHHPEHQNNPG